MTFAKRLARHPFFSLLTRAELQKLKSASRLRRAHAGGSLKRKGDVADSLLVVVSGVVNARFETTAGSAFERATEELQPWCCVGARHAILHELDRETPASAPAEKIVAADASRTLRRDAGTRGAVRLAGDARRGAAVRGGGGDSGSRNRRDHSRAADAARAGGQPRRGRIRAVQVRQSVGVGAGAFEEITLRQISGSAFLCVWNNLDRARVLQPSRCWSSAIGRPAHTPPTLQSARSARRRRRTFRDPRAFAQTRARPARARSAPVARTQAGRSVRRLTLKVNGARCAGEPRRGRRGRRRAARDRAARASARARARRRPRAWSPRSASPCRPGDATRATCVAPGSSTLCSGRSPRTTRRRAGRTPPKGTRRTRRTRAPPPPRARRRAGRGLGGRRVGLGLGRAGAAAFDQEDGLRHHHVARTLLLPVDEAAERRKREEAADEARAEQLMRERGERVTSSSDEGDGVTVTISPDALRALGGKVRR